MNKVKKVIRAILVIIITIIGVICYAISYHSKYHTQFKLESTNHDDLIYAISNEAFYIKQSEEVYFMAEGYKDFSLQQYNQIRDYYKEFITKYEEYIREEGVPLDRLCR